MKLQRKNRIEEMRDLFRDGFDTADIAEILNMSEAHVWNERGRKWSPPKPPALRLALLALTFSCIALAVSAISASAESWPVCSGGNRAARAVTCVVDGDTIWFRGEKIRVANIDTPEMRGKCRSEIRRARRARDRLAELLRGGAVRFERFGRDRYGRTLAAIRIDGRDAGARLIAEGLAVRYGNGKPDWCGVR